MKFERNESMNRIENVRDSKVLNVWQLSNAFECYSQKEVLLLIRFIVSTLLLITFKDEEKIQAKDLTI